MKGTISATDLDLLHLSRQYDLGEVTEIPKIGADVGEGRGLGEMLTLAALLQVGLGQARFFEARLEPVRAAGFDLEVSASNPRILKLTSRDGQPITLRASGGMPSSPDPTDGGTVYLEAEPGGSEPRVTLVSVPDGRGLIVKATNERPLLAALERSPLRVEPFASVRAPVDAWCAGLEDSWLRTAIRERAGSNDPWQIAVAAGLVIRLTDPPASMATEARRWARALGAAEVQTIADLALAEVGIVDERLQDLREGLDLEALTWWRELTAQLHRRDDLEGVRIILTEAGSVERLEGVMRGLDRRGSVFVRSLPRTELEDPRLERVLLGDPEAWWAMLAERGDT